MPSGMTWSLSLSALIVEMTQLGKPLSSGLAVTVLKRYFVDTPALPDISASRVPRCPIFELQNGYWQVVMVILVMGKTMRSR